MTHDYGCEKYRKEFPKSTLCVCKDQGDALALEAGIALRAKLENDLISINERIKALQDNSSPISDSAMEWLSFVETNGTGIGLINRNAHKDAVWFQESAREILTFIKGLKK